jgi:hypothetical protein
MIELPRYHADRGLNMPDVWYIRDHDVPTGMLPVIMASTSSEAYAKMIADALNAAQEKKASKPISK